MARGDRALRQHNCEINLEFANVNIGSGTLYGMVPYRKYIEEIIIIASVTV